MTKDEVLEYLNSLRKYSFVELHIKASAEGYKIFTFQLNNNSIN